MLNTFEHGYTDGIRARQRLLGSDDYKAGYEKGVKTRVAQRRTEIMALGALALTMGGVLAILVARLAVELPV